MFLAEALKKMEEVFSSKQGKATAKPKAAKPKESAESTPKDSKE